jgi:hypothetical protein
MRLFKGFVFGASRMKYVGRERIADAMVYRKVESCNGW